MLFFSSANETDDGVATRTEADQSQKAEHASDDRPKTGNINVVLASAGNTLEGDDAEIVLNPLRLAFETKSLKILESALDCLHVHTFSALIDSCYRRCSY